ncbi:RNA polymerase sigma factor [Roseivirga pacifica]|uniref:RNA polymerase sigma factor n=1 Tax=Roseivirga pacifica TaxID=1267423 RepID=UPI002095870C|nr:sigma-70 family RNA polymerase sigma factor [Roseivirga pacifica]MCO6359053.1 sigma-70 family RNA polymerase sigma factor [Roseivirga pacifica]MCO6365311.1 sigma-70 family RNA polymerase sigma factor [Roseivirga pacifica]MCO6371959.1 sigma-70 family RNA polymerase sigma factor [Roseivirga pacifica]MCO6375930.1 sigma-70 family RNA polymerase sigma factor [Roseivirga pacifica]MCO6379337.1 sigma-70 family RNA polymerase sigma factor [Roseivirga pacifica]
MAEENIFSGLKTSSLSDEELIQFIQNGGPERYFSILADRHQAYVLRKCKGFVKSDDEAEDLSQEVFIKVFMQLKSFRSEAKFKTWLYTIIYHTCLDYLRKRKKSTHDIISEKLAEEIAEVIDTDEVDQELLLQALEQLLEKITPEEKLLLMLKYKEKQPLQAIVATLKLSESAVKMRLKRAKEKVNKLYNAQQKLSEG